MRDSFICEPKCSMAIIASFRINEVIFNFFQKSNIIWWTSQAKHNTSSFSWKKVLIFWGHQIKPRFTYVPFTKSHLSSTQILGQCDRCWLDSWQRKDSRTWIRPDSLTRKRITPWIQRNPSDFPPVLMILNIRNNFWKRGKEGKRGNDFYESFGKNQGQCWTLLTARFSMKRRK